MLTVAVTTYLKRSPMSHTPTQLKQKLAIGGAVVGTLLSALAINALVGHPARLVDLVGLFAAAFGAGAALVVAIRGVR